MSDLLFLNLLRTSLIVGALTLILTLLSPFWDRRFSARWKKRLWYLLSLVLLAGIFFSIPGGRAPIVVALPEQTIQVVHRQSGIPRVQAATPETVAPHAPGHPGGGEAPLMDAPTSPAPAAQTSVPLLHVLKVVWLLGAAGMLTHQLIKERHFQHRLRRWAKPVECGRLAETYRATCGERGCVRPPRLFLYADAGGPMLAGPFHPRLLLPDADLTEDDALWIFRHELTHWSNHDLLWKVLLLAAHILHWFNPAVWLLRRMAGQDMERACDEQVLAHAALEDRRFYGIVLLNVLQKCRGSALSTGFSGGKRVLAERLEGIMSPGKGRGALPAILCMLAAVCAVTLVACTVTSPARQEPSASHAGESTVAATLPLTDLSSYAPPPGMEPDLVPTNAMGEVLLEQTLPDGTEIVLYREPGSAYTKYWALRQGDSLLRFCMEESAYGGGSCAVEAYADLFGHSGFRIEVPRGAGYQAFDYFYLDEEGVPRLLADCANLVVEHDLNGDGEKELLYFYHGTGEAVYYFGRNGTIYKADVTGLLRERFPDWTIEGMDPEHWDNGCLPLIYRVGAAEDTGEYGPEKILLSALLCFTPDAIEVLIPEAQAPLDNQSEWAGRYYTLLDGVPVARYAGETGWTPLGPAVAPPREWEYEDLAGRDTATTLFGEPGISMQMVDAQNGWLAATYGHGVGGADTYVYRTHDGGGTWTETGQLLQAAWWPSKTAFFDNEHAIISIGRFNGSPVLITHDGGETWNRADLPFYGDTWEVWDIRRLGTQIVMTATVFGDAYTGDETLISYDWGKTWLLDRGEYQVGLRQNRDGMEAYVRQGGAETAVEPIPDWDAAFPRPVELRSFENIMGWNGFLLSNHTMTGTTTHTYYIVEDHDIVQIADSFGFQRDDHFVDLDGDGVRELICNVAYNIGGTGDVMIYRRSGDAVEVAGVNHLIDPPQSPMMRMPSKRYDESTGAIVADYHYYDTPEKDYTRAFSLQYDALAFSPYE